MKFTDVLIALEVDRSKRLARLDQEPRAVEMTIAGFRICTTRYP